MWSSSSDRARPDLTRPAAIGIVGAPDGTDLEIIVDPHGNSGRRDAVQFFDSLHELDFKAA